MKTPYLIQSARLFLVALAVAAGLQACKKDDETQPAPTPTPTPDPTATIHVKLSNNPALGNLLTDADGRTLYMFSKDADGSSACKDGCLDAWPLFYQKDLKVGDGLNAADFGTITRADGKKQNTFRGSPLYRFAQDAAAGETRGEGVGKNWFVAKPEYTLFLAEKTEGKFLVDALGRTLYTFGNDTEDISNCNGGCLQNWPVFFTEKVVLPSLLNAGKFGTITRADGKKQLTYNKKPLYYFSGDAKRGDNNGAAIPNWFLVTPAL